MVKLTLKSADIALPEFSLFGDGLVTPNHGEVTLETRVHFVALHLLLLLLSRSFAKQ